MPTRRRRATRRVRHHARRATCQAIALSTRGCAGSRRAAADAQRVRGYLVTTSLDAQSFWTVRGGTTSCIRVISQTRVRVIVLPQTSGAMQTRSAPLTRRRRVACSASRSQSSGVNHAADARHRSAVDKAIAAQVRAQCSVGGDGSAKGNAAPEEHSVPLCNEQSRGEHAAGRSMPPSYPTHQIRSKAAAERCAPGPFLAKKTCIRDSTTTKHWRYGV